MWRFHSTLYLSFCSAIMLEYHNLPLMIFNLLGFSPPRLLSTGCEVWLLVKPCVRGFCAIDILLL